MKFLLILLILHGLISAQYHHWREIPSPVNYPKAFDITSTDELYVAGDGKLYKTVNGGKNWIPIAEGQTGILFEGLYIDPLDRIFLYNQNHVACYVAESDSFFVIKEISGTLQGCRIYGSNILLKIDDIFTYTSDFGVTWKTITDIPAGVAKFLLVENRAFYNGGTVQYVYDLQEEEIIRTYMLPWTNLYTYKLFGDEIYVLFGEYTYVTKNEFITLNYFTNKPCTYFEKDPAGNFYNQLSGIKHFEK